MRIVRLIEYNGDIARMRSTLERSWPDGMQLGGHIRIMTLEGEQFADVKLRHPDWETGDPKVQPILSCKIISTALLEDLRDFLDNYSDVIDGDDGIANVPNEAMSLLSRLEQETGI